MPIEIKELHIKAVISDTNKPSEVPSLTKEDITKLKKEITKEVSDEVMRMLQQKNER